MIAIIKYNAGNIGSVQNALDRLGYKSIITNDPNAIRQADKVIFPGVGEAASAMSYLRAHQLDNTILSLQQPVLAICLGLQLLCRYSAEGYTACLGVFDTVVEPFPAGSIVPHMGWNNFSDLPGTPNELLRGVNRQDDLYYVHSYYARVCSHTIATARYGVTFSAALHKDNFYATQFHPEKSAATGEQVLQNFLKL